MRLLAAVLLALTTMLVGVAHRPPNLASLDGIAAAAVAFLPDGTPVDFCHGGVDDADRRGHPDHAVAPCDACRLADAPGLAAVAAVALPAPPVIARVRLGHDTAALSGSRRPTPVSRGPPAIA